MASGGRSSPESLDEIDFSVIRTAIQMNHSMVDQILHGIHYGSDEIRNLLRDECDFIVECKVCRNMFRSLPNFVAHKRVYCQQTSAEKHESDVFACSPGNTETVVVHPDLLHASPENPDQNSAISVLDQVVNRTFEGRSKEYQFYTKIAEDVERQKVTKVTRTVALTSIPTNQNAVNVVQSEGDHSAEILEKYHKEQEVKAQQKPPSPKKKLTLSEVCAGLFKQKEQTNRSKLSIVASSYDSAPVSLKISARNRKSSPRKSADYIKDVSKRKFSTEPIVVDEDSDSVAQTTEKTGGEEANEQDQWWLKYCDVDLQKCTKCNKKFSSLYALKVHAKTKHVSKDKMPCPNCSNSYEHFSSLARHLRDNHNLTDTAVGIVKMKLQEKEFVVSEKSQKPEQSVSPSKPATSPEKEKPAPGMFSYATGYKKCDKCSKVFWKAKSYTRHYGSCKGTARKTTPQESPNKRRVSDGASAKKDPPLTSPGKEYVPKSIETIVVGPEGKILMRSHNKELLKLQEKLIAKALTSPEKSPAMVSSVPDKETKENPARNESNSIDIKIENEGARGTNPLKALTSPLKKPESTITKGLESKENDETTAVVSDPEPKRVTRGKLSSSPAEISKEEAGKSSQEFEKLKERLTREAGLNDSLIDMDTSEAVLSEQIQGPEVEIKINLQSPSKKSGTPEIQELQVKLAREALGKTGGELVVVADGESGVPRPRRDSSISDTGSRRSRSSEKSSTLLSSLPGGAETLRASRNSSRESKDSELCAGGMTRIVEPARVRHTSEGSTETRLKRHTRTVSAGHEKTPEKLFHSTAGAHSMSPMLSRQYSLPSSPTPSLQSNSGDGYSHKFKMTVQEMAQLIETAGLAKFAKDRKKKARTFLTKKQAKDTLRVSATLSNPIKRRKRRNQEAGVRTFSTRLSGDKVSNILSTGVKSKKMTLEQKRLQNSAGFVEEKFYSSSAHSRGTTGDKEPPRNKKPKEDLSAVAKRKLGEKKDVTGKQMHGETKTKPTLKVVERTLKSESQALTEKKSDHTVKTDAAKKAGTENIADTGNPDSNKNDIKETAEEIQLTDKVTESSETLLEKASSDDTKKDSSRVKSRYGSQTREMKKLANTAGFAEDTFYGRSSSRDATRDQHSDSSTPGKPRHVVADVEPEDKSRDETKGSTHDKSKIGSVESHLKSKPNEVDRSKSAGTLSFGKPTNDAERVNDAKAQRRSRTSTLEPQTKDRQISPSSSDSLTKKQTESVLDATEACSESEETEQQNPSDNIAKSSEGNTHRAGKSTNKTQRATANISSPEGSITEAATTREDVDKPSVAVSEPSKHRTRLSTGSIFFDSELLKLSPSKVEKKLAAESAKKDEEKKVASSKVLNFSQPASYTEIKNRDGGNSLKYYPLSTGMKQCPKCSKRFWKKRAFDYHMQHICSDKSKSKSKGRKRPLSYSPTGVAELKYPKQTLRVQSPTTKLPESGKRLRLSEQSKPVKVELVYNAGDRPAQSQKHVTRHVINPAKPSVPSTDTHPVITPAKPFVPSTDTDTVTPMQASPKFNIKNVKEHGKDDSSGVTGNIRNRSQKKVDTSVKVIGSTLACDNNEVKGNVSGRPNAACSTNSTSDSDSKSLKTAVSQVSQASTISTSTAVTSSSGKGFIHLQPSSSPVIVQHVGLKIQPALFVRCTKKGGGQGKQSKLENDTDRGESREAGNEPGIQASMSIQMTEELEQKYAAEPSSDSDIMFGSEFVQFVEDSLVGLSDDDDASDFSGFSEEDLKWTEEELSHKLDTSAEQHTVKFENYELVELDENYESSEDEGAEQGAAESADLGASPAQSRSSPQHSPRPVRKSAQNRFGHMEDMWVSTGIDRSRTSNTREYVLDVENPQKLICHNSRDVDRLLDEKHLKCKQCDTPCASISNLRRHVIFHLGWKRYKCKQCSYTCYDKSRCGRHTQIAHGETLTSQNFDTLVIDLKKEATKVRTIKRTNTLRNTKVQQSASDIYQKPKPSSSTRSIRNKDDSPSTENVVKTVKGSKGKEDSPEKEEEFSEEDVLISARLNLARALRK